MIRSTKSYVWKDKDSWKLSVAKPNGGHLVFDLPDCAGPKDARLDAADLLRVSPDQILVLNEDFYGSWNKSKWRTFTSLACEQLVDKSMLTAERVSV